MGAMPGIGSLVGVALLLPMTYSFNPTTAIIMLGAIYYSNMFGGAFSAILINVPGDAPAIMTSMDGYPLARKGKPGKALMTANISSFFGGLIGMVILTFFRAYPCKSRTAVRSRGDDDADAGGLKFHQLAH